MLPIARHQSASRRRSIRRRGPANGCLSHGLAWDSGMTSGCCAPGQPSCTVVHDGSLSTVSQRARCVLPATTRQAKPPAGKNWPFALQTDVASTGPGAGPPGQWSRISFQDKTLRSTSQRARWLVSPTLKQAYCPSSNRPMLAMHAASAHAGTNMPMSATAAGNTVLFNFIGPHCGCFLYRILRLWQDKVQSEPDRETKRGCDASGAQLSANQWKLAGRAPLPHHLPGIGPVPWTPGLTRTCRH